MDAQVKVGALNWSWSRTTLFLTRWEKNKVKIITGSFDSDYGHGFKNRFVKFRKDLKIVARIIV